MEQGIYYNNALARQAKSVPEYLDVINKNIDFVYLLNSITMKEIMDVKKIIITGCGDSYAAGIAMKPLMEEILGLEVEVCRAVEFSRHYRAEQIGDRPGNPLVVLISVSGTVTRVIEAAKRAKLHGANTLAITNSKDTPLAQECNHVIELNTPQVERAPGCSAYVACCHALILLCIRMGRVLSSYVPAMENAYRDQAMEYIHSYNADVADRIAAQMHDLADSWKDCKSFDLVGDGGAFASALFGGWKFVEAFGGVVTFEDSENWLHENFFFMQPEKIGTILYVDKNSPSFSRQMETAAVMKKIGRRVLVITDAQPELFEAGIMVCQIPSAKDYRYQPLMQHLPVVYLAAYLAEQLGTHYYREGDGDNWYEPSGIYPIRKSKVMVL